MEHKREIPAEYLIDVRVMDGSGDTKSIWDTREPIEVEAARAQFNTLTGKGYRAFRVKGEGERGERADRMTTFDPSAGAVIYVPAVVGG